MTSAGATARPDRRLVLLVGLAALVLVTVLAPHGVAAQTPEALYSFQAPLVIDNTDKGDAFQCFDRPRQTRRLVWNGTEYMVLDASVDIILYNPQTAQIVDKGHFGLGFGCGGVLSTPTPAPVDRTHGADGVSNVTVCDECRWGVINSNKGAVIFDLGNPAAGGHPVVDNPVLVGPNAATLTGGTYRVGSQQYIMLQGNYGSPYYNKCPIGQMGIYTLSASGSIGSNPIQCISDSAHFDPRAGQEVWVPFNGTPQPFYVYQQTTNPDVNVVRIGSDGIPVLPPENAVPFSGSNLDYFSLDTRGLSSSIDPHFWLLTTNQATSPSARVYKVTPAAAAVALDFQQVASFSGAAYDRGGIHYPYVFLTTPLGLAATVGFYDLSTSPPIELDHNYWNNPNSDFNTAAWDPSAAENTDAFFTDGGGWMYFPRYYQMARFQYTPSNPIASAAVSPKPAFWGDTVTVDASGSGGAAEYALWIDDDPTGTAASSVVVAGIKPGQGGAWGSAETLSWTVPTNANPPYYGHVAVRDVGRGYPYDPVNHPEMLDTDQVTLNLTPTARITAPDTVFINESGVLSAAASDGSPTGWHWTIVSPTNVTYTPVSRDVNQLFDEHGSWTVGLTVDWIGGAYSDTATPVTVTVKSALASFTISPTPPYNNGDITLDGSASRPADSLSYRWSVLDTSQQEVWNGTGQTVTIPADTLDVATYTVKLTVRNMDTQEVDIATQSMVVQGCAYIASVSPTQFTVDGGSGTLHVAASSTSCAWTAASSASWLVLSQTSGTGSKDVGFSVAANPGGIVRSATITVSGGGAIPATASVLQTSTGDSYLLISPPTPDRGQMVTFTVPEVSGVQGITWHFGGASCNGDPQDQDCSGIYCSPTTYTYSTEGTYNVSAVVHSSSGDFARTGTVVVQPSGECTGQPCSYSLTPSATWFGAGGGSGTVSVQADSGCPWSATSNSSWLHISGSNSGSGDGTFGFTVDANTDGAERSAQLSAGGKSVTISQSITATGTAVVPAAARTVGALGTNWQTDLWIFNPNNAQVTVNVRFYPDNADNSDVPDQPPLVQKLLPGLGTAFLSDVLGAVVPPGNLKGALGIDVAGSISRPLVISSRTFNTDPNGGTYGQFVPVVQGSPPPVSALLLSGLRQDGNFRTNIGLVSGSADAIGGIVIHVLDQDGNEVGSYGLGLNPYGMTQVDNIVGQLNPPPSGDMSIFRVKIDFVDWKGDHVSRPVTAYASVIDNNSSDAIFIPAVTEP